MKSAAPASYSSEEEAELLYWCDASAAVAGVAAALAGLQVPTPEARRLRGEGLL